MPSSQLRCHNINGHSHGRCIVCATLVPDNENRSPEGPRAHSHAGIVLVVMKSPELAAALGRPEVLKLELRQCS